MRKTGNKNHPRRRLKIVLVIVVIAILLLAAVIVSREMRQAPLDKSLEAMKALEKARTAQATQSARTDYLAAEKCLKKGQEAMAQVSGSWWPFYSYSSADSLFEESIRMSRSSLARAEKNQVGRKASLERQIRILADSVAVWRDLLDDSLPQIENEVLWREAMIKLRAADGYLKSGQTEAAAEAVDTIRTITGKLHRRHHLSEQKTQNDTSAADWIACTIADSKRQASTAIIVDKSKHALYLLKSGRVIDTVTCELGYNSGIQKKMSGDGATPEGMYRITRVNNASKYYRALLLSYPSADDRQRFENNLKAGSIPTNAKIGGLIEIHGHGDKGNDWTDGCIAIENREMDRLVKNAPVGTVVTIVRTWNKRK